MGQGDAERLVLAVLILAIDVARDEVQLAHWWGEHQAAMRMLDDAGRAAAIEAKDRRRAAWRAETSARAAKERGGGSRAW